MNETGIQYLSDEILLKVFKLLDKPNHLCNLSQVCRRFHLICLDNEIWEILFVEHMNHVRTVEIPANVKHQISWKVLFQVILLLIFTNIVARIQSTEQI